MTNFGDIEPCRIPGRKHIRQKLSHVQNESEVNPVRNTSEAGTKAQLILEQTQPCDQNGKPVELHVTPDRVIYLKERSMKMLKKDLILRNPLRLMGHKSDDILPPGGFGAVMARAGVGKTALLVQLALNSLLNSKNVLHISLDDPVNKVSLWYQEVFSHIAKQYNKAQMNELWDTLLPHRFIMTFKVEGFSVPKLEERLTDLIEQKIFAPHMIIIDGLPFDGREHDSLVALKDMARKNDWRIWFTVRTHRHEEPDEMGLPVQLSHLVDLFEVALQLQPDGEEIHICALRGGDTDNDQKNLQLDPATLLIKNDKSQ